MNWEEIMSSELENGLWMHSSHDELKDFARACKAQLEKQIEKIRKEIIEANAVEELTSDPSEWSEGYDNGAEAMVKRFLGILKAEKT